MGWLVSAGLSPYKLLVFASTAFRPGAHSPSAASRLRPAQLTTLLSAGPMPGFASCGME